MDDLLRGSFLLALLFASPTVAAEMAVPDAEAVKLGWEKARYALRVGDDLKACFELERLRKQGGDWRDDASLVADTFDVCAQTHARHGRLEEARRLLQLSIGLAGASAARQDLLAQLLYRMGVEQAEAGRVAQADETLRQATRLLSRPALRAEAAQRLALAASERFEAGDATLGAALLELAQKVDAESPAVRHLHRSRWLAQVGLPGLAATAAGLVLAAWTLRTLRRRRLMKSLRS